jgi:carbon monoxide dehydrogenase subunit G
MDMSGKIELKASKQRVWEALNDPEILKACIPGCESLEKTSDDGFAATAVLKVGPIKAKFQGKVRLLDIVAPTSYTITGEGQGGIAGFASGRARVVLEEIDPETTELSYDTEAKVGGKIAQLGARLIDSTAKKLAGQFFEQFGAQVSSQTLAGSGN